MKTIKKLLSTVFAFVLCMSVFALPSTAFAKTGTYVLDEYGLYSDEEFNTLESQAKEISEKYNVGVYVHTTSKMDGLSDPSSSQRTSYATTYYTEHDLGLGSEKSGLMLVLAVDSRDYVTIGHGAGKSSLSAKGIEELEENVTDKLHDNKWYEATQVYYKDADKQLAYYQDNGKLYKPIDLVDILIALALALGVPLIIAFFVVNGQRRAMKTAIEQTGAHLYFDEGSLDLTESSDQFVNTTIVATPRAKDNDNDSGGWGSGGGGFSSSGGGKF